MKFLKPLVVDRDPMDSGAIWWDMWRQNRRASTNAIGAIDVALWGHQGQGGGAAHPQPHRHMPL